VEAIDPAEKTSRGKTLNENITNGLSRRINDRKEECVMYKSTINCKTDGLNLTLKGLRL
jgi:hypothetical protein